MVKSSQNKTDEAIKNFDKALSIKKDYVAAYNNKGNFGTNIVVRGINNEELDRVAEKLKSKLL